MEQCILSTKLLNEGFYLFFLIVSSYLSKLFRKIVTPCLKVFCQLRIDDEMWY